MSVRSTDHQTGLSLPALGELIVPVSILAVLGLIVYLGLRFRQPPHARWKSLARELGLEFEAVDAGAGGMRVSGLLDGRKIKLESRYMQAVRWRQVLSDLWLELAPDVPASLHIRRAGSAMQAVRRGRAADGHAITLPLVWSVDGVSEKLATAIKSDPHCSQRLTNLFVAYPHALIEGGGIHVDSLGDFGERLQSTIDLTRLLALDLARVCRQSESDRDP